MNQFLVISNVQRESHYADINNHGGVNKNDNNVTNQLNSLISGV